MTMDWYLHAPMVFRILDDLEYLKKRGVKLWLEGFVIRQSGCGTYSPTHIDTYEKAIEVLRNKGCASTPHFEAICLLEGVSYYKILHRGQALINRLESR